MANKAFVVKHGLNPSTDNSVDLGTSTLEFQNLYIDGTAFLDAIGFGSVAMTLPTGHGTNGQVLKSNGSNALTWEDASTGGHTIQEEGSSLTQRTKLNFIGASITATDDSHNDATKITVTATGASLPVTRSDGSTSDPIALTSAALGESLVSDTSPQLGGNLDVNGQSIVSDGSNENIPITPHGTGSVVISKLSVSGTSAISGDMTFVDNAKVTLGTGGDADLYFDGTNTVLNTKVSGNGNLLIGQATDAGTDQAGYTAVQLGKTGLLMATTSATSNTETMLCDNVYLSGGAWKHINTDEASYIYQNSGTMRFYTAASASADASFNGGTRMLIAADGAVTLPSQPLFNASVSYNSQSNVTGDATNHTIVFDTEAFDRGADYNTSTGVFTAPVTGMYQLSVSVQWMGVTSGMNDSSVGVVTSNGGFTVWQDSASGISPNMTHNGTMLEDMDAGDTASVTIDFRNGSKVVDVWTASQFSGVLVA